MTTRMTIDSLGDVPGVRVPADQRCPACDLRMEAGTWAVEVQGQCVCSADCYNRLAAQTPESVESRAMQIAEQLQEDIRDLQSDIDYERNKLRAHESRLEKLISIQRQLIAGRINLDQAAREAEIDI